MHHIFSIMLDSTFVTVCFQYNKIFLDSKMNWVLLVFPVCQKCSTWNKMKDIFDLKELDGDEKHTKTGMRVLGVFVVVIVVLFFFF